MNSCHYCGRYVLKINIQDANSITNPMIISVLEPDVDLEYICSGESYIVTDIIYPVLDDSSVLKIHWYIS